MKRYLTIVVGVLAVALALTLGALKDERQERKRYEANTNALLAENEAYLTKLGKWAMDAQTLELNKREVERHYADACETIRAQGIKIKRLESMANTASETVVDITAPIRDTIIIRDTVKVVARAFDWSDAWVSISGIIEADSLSCRVESVDTLLQYVYRVPRKFLFIRWGTKEIRQTIISSNPHTKIVYSEHIRLKRKKR